MVFAIQSGATRARHRTAIPAATGKKSRDVVIAFAIAPSGIGHGAAVPSSRLLASARDRLWGLLSDADDLTVSEAGVILVRCAHSRRSPHRLRIASMTTNLARRPLRDGQADVHVDVGTTWAPAAGRKHVPAEALAEQAKLSLGERDLQARRWRTGSGVKGIRRPRTLLQLGVTLVATFLLPLILMLAGHHAGVAVAATLYVTVVAFTLTAAILQWAETVIGMRARPKPPPVEGPPPPASAIIAAYLPNEAQTILETLHVFLRHEYAGGLQVVLAYNSPAELPIESQLTALAAADPRLVLLRVPDSHSKAQNVNAALGVVTGQFVGVFDADHHPDPGSFDRASRWLAGDVDVVQGHCVVRNGAASTVARTVAVEFEQIYAVSHRGRQLLHGFGVFGGSNGYWKTEVLRTVRMVPSMLTEDIDSSIRATRAGAVIVNDPGLISRELAPETVGALWRQRMRWAQGWAQVTAVHARALVLGDELTMHQRVGMFFHLLWREAYPVIAALMWPVLAFYLWRDGVIGMSEPLLAMVTVFTLSTAPVHVLLTRRVADADIAGRGWWWIWYSAASLLAYQELKNVIARIAIVKLVMGERNWVVTPRTVAGAAASPPAPAAARHGNEGVRFVNEGRNPKPHRGAMEQPSAAA